MAKGLTIDIPEDIPLSREVEVMLYRFDRAGMIEIRRTIPQSFYLEWAVMLLFAIAGCLAGWYGSREQNTLIMIIGIAAGILFGLGAIWFYPRQWMDDRRPIVLTPDGVFIPHKKPLYWSDIRAIGSVRRNRRTHIVVGVSASAFARMLGESVHGMLHRDTREMMGPHLRTVMGTGDRKRELVGLITDTETWLVLPTRIHMDTRRFMSLLTHVRQRVADL